MTRDFLALESREMRLNWRHLRDNSCEAGQLRGFFFGKTLTSSPRAGNSPPRAARGGLRPPPVSYVFNSNGLESSFRCANLLKCRTKFA